MRNAARAAFDSGDFARCASLFRDARAHDSNASSSKGDAYDAACCSARAGLVDDAFARLAEARELGFRDARQMQRDEDLAPLHADARWANALSRVTAASAAAEAKNVAELATIFADDQGDREHPEKLGGKRIMERDAARRARVKELLDAHALKTSDDYFRAAMVYQHGTAVADFHASRDLALEAVKLDDKNKEAKWLAAASLDRGLMNEGKPQKYATQFRREGNVWVLYTVDASVSDEERAAWNVPPLAEAKARVERMNAAKH